MVRVVLDGGDSGSGRVVLGECIGGSWGCFGCVWVGVVAYMTVDGGGTRRLMVVEAGFWDCV